MPIIIEDFFELNDDEKAELRALEVLRQRQDKAMKNLVPCHIQDLTKKPNLFKNKNAKE